MLWEFSQILGDTVPNFSPRRFFHVFLIKIACRRGSGVVIANMTWESEHFKVIMQACSLSTESGTIHWPAKVAEGSTMTIDANPNILYFLYKKKTYGSMSSSNWAIFEVVRGRKTVDTLFSKRLLAANSFFSFPLFSWMKWILFTVGSVDQSIGRYSGRYSGR